MGELVLKILILVAGVVSIGYVGYLIITILKEERHTPGWANMKMLPGILQRC